MSKKYRNYTIVLYPEDQTHVQALEYIKKQFSYAYILHNKDIWEKDNINENTGEIKNKKGDKKKEHYHVLITFLNARSQESVLEEIGLDNGHIEPSSFYEMARYLIHLGYPNKYQYTIQEIKTNIYTRIENAIKREYNKEEEKSRILLDFIFKNTNQSILTFKKLTEFAMENDCLLELQKKSYFYNQFCDQTGFKRY